VTGRNSLFPVLVVKEAVTPVELQVFPPLLLDSINVNVLVGGGVVVNAIAFPTITPDVAAQVGAAPFEVFNAAAKPTEFQSISRKPV
jgi:hypothetical protein